MAETQTVNENTGAAPLPAKNPFSEEEAKEVVKKKPGLRSDDPGITTKTRDELHKQRMVRIIIDSTREEKEDVPVSVNGHSYLIKRDKEVELPLSVLEVLDNAEMTDYKQVRRENGEGYDMVPTKVKRFPYRRVF